MKEEILAYLSKVNKRLTMEELAIALKLNKADDFKEMVQTIAMMERKEEVAFNKKGKIYIPDPLTTIEGIFRANERGFGFVTIDEEEGDVFIPQNKTNYALDGDTVLIDILQPASPFSDKGAEGKIVEVKKRALTQVVGTFHAYDEKQIKETDLYGYIQPKAKKISHYTVYVAATGIKPVEGEVVIVEITHYPEKNYATALEGIVKQTIGHVDDPGMDILEVIHSYGIPIEFNEKTMEASNQISDTIEETDIKDRKDLRYQTIVTIDGADAKDLDDAVCVWKKENGNYHLGVHIADVSYYVTENSPIDEEASERGTSVYLTDRVIPMIPHRLSNGICSLNPKVPRFTMSCEMEIDLEGNVISYEIFPSVIQTTERMTYDSVNLILDEEDEEEREKYAAIVPMFEEMKELHHILEQMRKNRGAINFDDHEAKVIVDENGKPLEIIGRERFTGERLIESFMLCANETVAKHFSDKMLPFIYRIHEHPKAEKLERFFDFASALGIAVQGTVEDFDSKKLQKVLEDVEGSPEEIVISTMLLRSMQQAKYSEHNYGHYGLGAEYYTHFTSPIRRYPDLMVHRLIREYLQSTDKKRKEKWETLLPDIATHASQMERRAVDCEREVDSMKKAEFMQFHIGDEFEGVISSVVKFGLFVELPNTIEGMVHISALNDDYYNFLEKHLALVGERTGQVYRIGQKVVVKVVKADPETREIDFQIVSSEEVPKIIENKEKSRRGRKGKSTKATTKGRKGKKSKNEFSDNFSAGKGKKKGKGKKPFYQNVAKKKKKKR